MGNSRFWCNYELLYMQLLTVWSSVMYEQLDRTKENCIGIRVSDRLTEDDLKRLRPFLEERAREYGTLYLLMWMDDWHGWASLSALWEDLKTDLEINENVERLAMVGEADWERWMAKLTAPFAHGEVQYFDREELEEAWEWVTSPTETVAG